jgi:GT2 family glycosyltransferase
MQPQNATLDADDGRPGSLPPVVAVLATGADHPTLGSALEGLRDQEYSNLTSVVVAVGGGDATAAEVADVLPGAFIRREAGSPSFGTACNLGAGAVEGATFLLFLHDDTVLEPGAVHAMVTEAFRANAGVVGAKLVDWDQPDVLLGVGDEVDKFGFVVPVAEPGELDQAQHDGAREVFMVPSAAMLVRADLFADLGGFSEQLGGGGADLDLCWRARVAGAHVVVMPAAVARHGERSSLGDDPTDRRRLAIRHQARVVLTCYSLPYLARLLPQVVVLSVLDLLASLVTGHFGRAWDIVSAWAWNLAHLPSAVSARARIRRSRRASDSTIRSTQLRGSARLATAFRNLRTSGGRRVPDALAAARGLSGSWQESATMAGVVLVVLLGAVYLIGSRQLLSDGIPAIRDLLPLGRPADLAGEWWNGWRSTGIGHAGPAPVMFPLLWLGHVVTFGSDGFVRTVVLLAGMPIGAIGAWRLLRGVADVRARVVATLAYAFVPLPYDAIAEGRWTVLVCYAVLPFVLRRLAVASGAAPFERDRRPVVEGLRMAIVLALAASVAPAAGVVAAATTAVVAVALLVARGRDAALRVAVAGAVGVVGAAAALLPTTLDLLVRPDRWVVLWGSAPSSRPHLAEVLRFTTGSTTGGVLWSAVPIAAVLVLIVGRTWRFRWGVIGWLLAFASWGAVLLVDRWWPGDPHPVVGLLLVPGAVGLAMAVALGVESFSTDVLGGAFGWRQAIASLAGLVAALAVMPFLAAAIEGRWGLPDGDAVAATSTLQDRGARTSRTLWIGEPDVMPMRTTRLGPDIGFAAVRGVEPTVSFIRPARPGPGDATLRTLLTSATAGGSSRLGGGLARLGVRYVVVVTNLTAGAGGRTPASVDAMRTALAQQLDLSDVDVAPGLDVYRNTEFAPSPRLARGIDGDHSPSGGHLALLAVQLALVGAIIRGALRRGPRRAAPTEGGDGG